MPTTFFVYTTNPAMDDFPAQFNYLHPAMRYAMTEYRKGFDVVVTGCEAHTPGRDDRPMFARAGIKPDVEAGPSWVEIADLREETINRLLKDADLCDAAGFHILAATLRHHAETLPHVV